MFLYFNDDSTNFFEINWFRKNENFVEKNTDVTFEKLKLFEYKICIFVILVGLIDKKYFNLIVLVTKTIRLKYAYNDTIFKKFNIYACSLRIKLKWFKLMRKKLFFVLKKISVFRVINFSIALFNIRFVLLI